MQKLDKINTLAILASHGISAKSVADAISADMKSRKMGSAEAKVIGADGVKLGRTKADVEGLDQTSLDNRTLSNFAHKLERLLADSEFASAAPRIAARQRKSAERAAVKAAKSEKRKTAVA